VPDSGDRAASGSAATVERAADVLLLFAKAPTLHLGVTEIATALGLSKTAVHRILSSFRNKGIVELDAVTRKYGLGPVIVSLALSYLDNLDVRAVAGPELARLSAETNETATLSIRTGFTRVYVDQVTPEREVLMSVQIGVPHPLHAGASSKAFLAFLPDEDIEEYLAGPLPAVTSATITDRRKLMKELRVVRQRGWAQSLGERQPGAGSVAAPIFDHREAPVAVVSVCGPAERMVGEADVCAAHLLAVTRRISAKLGATRDIRSDVGAAHTASA
jgi:IclR family acetate operon transcriptional repressor